MQRASKKRRGELSNAGVAGEFVCYQPIKGRSLRSGLFVFATIGCRYVESVAVMLRLVRTIDVYAQVSRLLGGELGELDADLLQM